MFIFLVLIFLLFILDLAAMRWGADSRDNLTSAEWEHRRYQSEKH